jgi:dTDP-4-dehydrorhamnose reductase
MNILVTGANGQLGNELRLVAALAPASGHRFVFTDINDVSGESAAMLRRLGGAGVDMSTRRLDITDAEAVRSLVRESGIDAVVNCAAYTDVDAAESHPDLAELLNARAPQILAEAMRDAGGLLVHVSTDYVFGGDPCNTPCREGQTGTPTGVYGLTKLHGEQAIQASGCRYVILRTAWLYSEFGKNFVRTMLRLTAEKPQLKVVFDQAGTPTYAGDLAAAIFTILAQPVPGIYHYSNEGVCSWYDFTKMIAEMADQVRHDCNCHSGLDHRSHSGLDPESHPSRSSCDIQPCHSDEFPSPVKRPAYSVLDKTKVKQTFGLSVPYWTDSLRKCLSALI